MHKTTRRARYFIFLLLIGFCVAALSDGLSAINEAVQSSRTYYVDSANGSDENSGTAPVAAWRTLAKVNATTFSLGDHILLKSGSSFTGQLWPKGSGTEKQPIVIDKYGGEAKAIINANGESEDAVLLKNQEYWEINNLEITNTGTRPGSRRGANLVAENSGDLHHIYLRNLYVHDVNGSNDDKVNGGINYHCIGDSRPSRFIDLRIENNRIRHVDRSGIFGWSTHWMRSKWYPSLGVVIRNNVLDDIGGDGIVAVATDGTLIEHNVVSNANQRSDGYNVGIWPWSADNTIVQYNEVYRTKGTRDSEGFDSDWNSRNTVIQYNYSHDNEGGFLLICNEGGDPESESIGNSGTIVRYNISQNDHHRGIHIAGPVTNATIYNNTIYTPAGEKVEVVQQSDWKGWADGTQFYNNVFYVAGTGLLSYGVSKNSDGTYVTAPGFGPSTNNIFDHNLYYGNISAPDDPHALHQDPLFAAPGQAGIGRATASAYRLFSRSPAIGAGRPVASQSGKDFVGNDVPSCHRIDLGAIQSGDCRSER